MLPQRREGDEVLEAEDFVGEGSIGGQRVPALREEAVEGVASEGFYYIFKEGTRVGVHVVKFELDKVYFLGTNAFFSSFKHRKFVAFDVDFEPVDGF